jgi:hypothetical protein
MRPLSTRHARCLFFALGPPSRWARTSAGTHGRGQEEGGDSPVNDARTALRPLHGDATPTGGRGRAAATAGIHPQRRWPGHPACTTAINGAGHGLTRTSGP